MIVRITFIKQKLIPILLSLAVALLGWAVLPARAATVAGSGNGLRVSPVRNDLTIAAGHSQTIDVFVQNVTSSPAHLQVLVNDFVAGTDETGAPKILLNGQPAPTHGLKQFVAPIDNITVAPGKQATVPVTITIPENTAGGGYFGVVRFAPTSSGPGNVSLAASVGSLVLVTVPGNITDNLTIASFDVRHITTDKNGTLHENVGSLFFSPKNLYSVVRFNNQGNVQEEPFGKVQLEKGGKVLATYEVNNTDPRGNVLPGSIRKFALPLSKLSSFGKYTLVGNFGYGPKGQLLSAKTTFYVVPLGLIFIILLAIALIVLSVIFIPRFVRAYNRRILRKAGRR